MAVSGRKIEWVVVHHSVSAWGTDQDIKHWHMDPKPRGNGWLAPGYHVVITNAFPTYNSYSHKEPVAASDGFVHQLWPESKISNGCLYVNEHSLHVCLIGDLDKTPATKKQWDSLVGVLAAWCRKYGLKPGDVYGHGEMQRKVGKEGYSKTCPGLKVDMNVVRGAVAEKMKG